MLAVGEPLEVTVPVVVPVTEELLQHKSLVLVTLNRGEFDGLKEDVYFLLAEIAAKVLP